MTELEHRKQIVVIGLGMVGVAFVEKMLERDLINKEYVMTVLGEESFLAYNRVGLTEYFSHQNAPELLLNDQAWYDNVDTNHMTYRINEPVVSIDRTAKTVTTRSGAIVPYDIVVLATGSSAVLPTALLPSIPGKTDFSDMGVFVYRTIEDVRKLISFSETVKSQTAGPKKAIVVGGGLLGLEAAKALYDLDCFENLSIVHRSGWLLSQQLDQTGGTLLADSVRDMGIEVKLFTEIKELIFTEGQLSGVLFKDGSTEDCQLLCYAIGITSRDDLAAAAGLETSARKGVVVNDLLQSSDPNIYAIGECASWNEKVFGLIAPGVEMADVLSFNLTQAKHHAERQFEEPDLGTRLKLMGVDVASFGDYFADTKGPKWLPHGAVPKGKVKSKDDVVALTYTDHFAKIYKKLIFTKKGDYLLGGILVGDISEFTKLSSLAKGRKKLDKSPTEFMVGSSSGGDDDVLELDDSTQICSCHNISKGTLVAKIRDGSATSFGELKSSTKAGTACGGCEGTVKAIFNAEMKAMGQTISNSLCIHFKESRAELFHIIMVKKLDTFEKVMKEASRMPESLGCEICKPTIGSILASLYNKFVMDKEFAGLQETNDRFLGNIQRNGTYSVVPRVSAGEVTPEKLIVLGQVARKYNLYTKVTGGQRIDLFGAQKQDLPAIWEELGKVGFESGHAYGKSLRTVKSCVGSTWCRYGIGDSVGMAVRLEERYKSIRGPHKFKGGVSGCVRDCAEFHNKDFGLCAVKNGYNVYVGGNGGMKPAHAVLLQADVLPDRVVPLIDRYLMFYIRTGERLQRTARWLEALPGGIEYLRDVVVHDKLGICDELESQMNSIVGTFFDEWKAATEDPTVRKDFRQFANTKKRIETMDIVYERGQARPADWPEEASAKEVFKDLKWSRVSWEDVCSADDLNDASTGSSTTVLIGDTQLAIFKINGKLYASQNMCGHKRAFVLSQGILSTDENDQAYVSCPLHKRNYILEGGGVSEVGSCKNDESQSIATFDAKEENGRIFLKLPPVDELDAALGTNKWKIRKTETEPRLESFDKAYPMNLPTRVTCGEEQLAW